MKIVFSDSKDYRGEFVVEAAKIVGILAGIGATPLLQEQFHWFWVVGLVAGILPIVAGIYYLARRRRREKIAKGEAPAGFREPLCNRSRRLYRIAWRDRIHARVRTGRLRQSRVDAFSTFRKRIHASAAFEP